MLYLTNSVAITYGGNICGYVACTGFLFFTTDLSIHKVCLLLTPNANTLHFTNTINSLVLLDLRVFAAALILNVLALGLVIARSTNLT